MRCTNLNFSVTVLTLGLQVEDFRNLDVYYKRQFRRNFRVITAGPKAWLWAHTADDTQLWRLYGGKFGVEENPLDENTGW